METEPIPSISHTPASPKDSINFEIPNNSPNFLGAPELQGVPKKRRSMDTFNFGSSSDNRSSSAPSFSVNRANSFSGPTITDGFAMTVTNRSSSLTINTTTQTTKKSFLSFPLSPFSRTPGFFRKFLGLGPKEPDRDELPEDLARLDGFMNYHLGELDRIILELDYHNGVKARLQVTLGDISRREGMNVSTNRINQRIADIDDFRSKLGSIVGYHRYELERVTDERKSIALANNKKVIIPDA